MLTIVVTLYVTVRYSFEYRNNPELSFKMKDIPTTISIISMCFLNFAIEDNVDKLLSTRFNKCKQTWFHSL